MRKKREGVETDHDTPETASGGKGLSLPDSLLFCAGILSTGALLFRMGGGFPPLAWRHLTRLLGEHAPAQPQFALIIAQLVLLLAAWGLLLMLTLRITSHCWQQRPAPGSQHPPTEQHLKAPKLRQEAVEAQEASSEHTQPNTTSESVSLQVNRAGGESPQHEDKGQDTSRPLQAADVQSSSPVRPLQPALFGESMQFTFGSCSDEGIQQEPSTTAYLLTESGSDTNASFSWPGGLFALADRIPRNEPGHTKSCLAVASMRDSVIHACTGTQLLGDEALASLLGEQVRRVTHIIGQQNQSDEADPAMAAALVVGSQMVVANLGDARVYLCCSPEGFYQITDAPGVVRLLTERGSPTSRHSPHQNKRDQHLRRRATSRTTTDHSSAVPLVKGDIVLLCSDGVWSVLHAAYLEHIMRSAGPDPSAICSALLLAVRKSGGIDPVRLIVLHCHHQHHEHRSWQETLDMPSGRSGNVIQQARGEP